MLWGGLWFYFILLLFWLCCAFIRGLPGGTSGKESACQSRRYKRLGFHPWVWKEEEIATRSSIPAWKIPWTEESGRLESMGSQRVRYDWAHTHAHALVAMHRLFIQALATKHRLSCPAAGGILVLKPGIEPRSLALQSEFLSAGPPGKSLYRGFF